MALSCRRRRSGGNWAALFKTPARSIVSLPMGRTSRILVWPIFPQGKMKPCICKHQTLSKVRTGVNATVEGFCSCWRKSGLGQRMNSSTLIGYPSVSIRAGEAMGRRKNPDRTHGRIEPRKYRHDIDVSGSACESCTDFFRPHSSPCGQAWDPNHNPCQSRFRNQPYCPSRAVSIVLSPVAVVALMH